MTRLAGPLLVLAAAAAVAAPSAGAAEPRPGTFAGSLGVKVPAGAAASVRAIDRSTGAILKAVDVGRTGRFSLSLPPGAYAIAGTIVPRKGRVVSQSLVGLTLRAGQRRTKASLKNAKRVKKRRQAPRARAAFAQEGGKLSPGTLAVAIPAFTGLTGDGALLQKGLTDLVMTELVQAAGADDGCSLVVRESTRIDEVLKELAFQQSKYVDPKTRSKRALIVPDVEVRGTLTEAGGSIAYVLRLVDPRNNEELGLVSGSFASGETIGKAEEIARSVKDELCKLSDLYEVKLVASGAGTFATHDATGRLSSTLGAVRSRSVGDGQIWRDAGTLIWEDVVFTTKTECEYIDQRPGLLPWSVVISDRGDGTLNVAVNAAEGGVESLTTASVVCPGDPPSPPIPGQPGPSFVQLLPVAFTVPYAGGSHPIASEVTSGADGFRNAGTITVTPKGVTSYPGPGG